MSLPSNLNRAANFTPARPTEGGGPSVPVGVCSTPRLCQRRSRSFASWCILTNLYYTELCIRVNHPNQIKVRRSPRGMMTRSRRETMNTEPLPHLNTFAEAAERSSFTAAARALGLTQAAVSQRVQALERDLGVPLFRRVGGKVELTDAGHRLHEYARRIRDLHREV